MKLEKIIEYNEINEEAVKYLYNAVVNECWSVSYASRKVKGGIAAVKRNFNKWPMLEEMYSIYMARKRKKVFFGYRNI